MLCPLKTTLMLVPNTGQSIVDYIPKQCFFMFYIYSDANKYINCYTQFLTLRPLFSSKPKNKCRKDLTLYLNIWYWNMDSVSWFSNINTCLEHMM